MIRKEYFCSRNNLILRSKILLLVTIMAGLTACNKLPSTQITTILIKNDYKGLDGTDYLVIDKVEDRKEIIKEINRGKPTKSNQIKKQYEIMIVKKQETIQVIIGNQNLNIVGPNNTTYLTNPNLRELIKKMIIKYK